MRLLRYALSICALMPLMASAGHGAPLAVPAPFAAPATLDQTATSAAIKAGVSACHWQASFERRGYVEALLQDKSLLIRVGLLYDPKQIRMVYLESKGFHYQIDENGTVIVHKKLNYWLLAHQPERRSGTDINQTRRRRYRRPQVAWRRAKTRRCSTAAASSLRPLSS